MVPHHNPAADVLSDTWRSVVTRSDYEHGALLAKARLGVGRRCIGDPPPPMSPAMAPSLPGLRHPPLIPRADGGAPARLEMNPPARSGMGRRAEESAARRTSDLHAPSHPVLPVLPYLRLCGSTASAPRCPSHRSACAGWTQVYLRAVSTGHEKVDHGSLCHSPPLQRMKTSASGALTCMRSYRAAVGHRVYQRPVGGVVEPR